ncbi:hypothetical protein BLOT_004272 [Blomia tropicalis]|nr:hypothetical protein BLOT_004272 [Blomia tropicalis]
MNKYMYNQQRTSLNEPTSPTMVTTIDDYNCLTNYLLKRCEEEEETLIGFLVNDLMEEATTIEAFALPPKY